MSEPVIIRQRKDAAKLLDISDRGLGLWAAQPWFPAAGRTAEGWNVTAIREAREIHGRKGSEESDTAKRVRLGIDAEKLKQARIRTRKEDLNLLEQEKELLPRRGWELFASTLLTELGDWCDQIPDLIAADAPLEHQVKLRARLKDELDRRRRDLAHELERKARELDQETTSES